jgi:hypothetical protein
MFGQIESECSIQQNACRTGSYAVERRDCRTCCYAVKLAKSGFLLQIWFTSEEHGKKGRIDLENLKLFARSMDSATKPDTSIGYQKNDRNRMEDWYRWRYRWKIGID